MALFKNVEDRADIDPSYQDAEGEPDSQVPNRFPESNSARPIGFRQADGTILPSDASTPEAVGVSAKLLHTSLHIITDISEYAKVNLDPIARGDMHSLQLVPTYVSNGRLGPDDISLNGWTPNSKEDVGKSNKEMHPIAKVQGKRKLSDTANSLTIKSALLTASGRPRDGIFAMRPDSFKSGIPPSH